MRVIIADRKPLLRDALAALIRVNMSWADVVTTSSLAEATAGMGLTPFGLLVLEAVQVAGDRLVEAIRLIHPGWRLALLGELPEEASFTTIACDVHWHDGTESAAMLADIPRLLGGRAASAAAASWSAPVAVPVVAVAPAVTVAPTTADPASRGLTRRQQDVLGLLSEGRSTKEIARSLNLGVGTIKAHLDGLYRTLGVHNRTAAVHLARQLPQPEPGNVVRLEPRPLARPAMAAAG